MVITWGNGVDIFSLDPSLGEFILTNAKVKIPEKPKTIYSCNEGNYVLWDDQTKAYVEQCKNAKKPYSARYIGSMVADVHSKLIVFANNGHNETLIFVICCFFSKKGTLLYGGIFFYPADTKNKNGKLRLLYEVSDRCLPRTHEWLTNTKRMHATILILRLHLCP
jgi:fructose-1,6-bisphosphatase I